MLSPYVCVVCEKVIFAKDDVASLINLFNKMVMAVPEEAPEIPKNAVAPKEWAVFSSWNTELGDELKEYFLCTQVLYPDKSQFGDVARLKMKIESGKRFQAGVQILGFPVGQVGTYSVSTWVEENQGIVVNPIEFTFEVEISRKKEA